MKVLTADIIAKIPDLPADVEDLVTLSGINFAEVQSFRPDCTDVYKTRISPHKHDPGDGTVLDVFCPCTSVKLCHHLTAFYAIAKRDDPAVIVALAKRKGLPADPLPETVSEEGKEADAPLSRRAEGLKLIAGSQQKFAEAVQDLADGIALVVKEEV